MACSKKQLIANRKNAQKSTGPKTPEGKQKVSQNAVKHGLYCKAGIINSPNLKEDKEEYKTLLNGLYDEFVPVGVREERLVHIMANCMWQNRRAIKAESVNISERLNAQFPQNETGPDNNDSSLQNNAEVNIVPNNNARERISRLETRLDHQLHQAYSYLVYYQSRGKAEMLLKLWKRVLK